MTTSAADASDDYIEISPRPVIELVGRAAALAVVARRGLLESTADSDTYVTDTDRFELYSWARSELREWLTADELRLLGITIGELTEDDLAGCDAALVGASTVAWALRVTAGSSLPLPPDGVAEEATIEWAPEPWTTVSEVARDMAPRDESELAAERERWELWYWRALDAEDGSDELAEVVASLLASPVIALADNDLATDSGLPYHDLNTDTQREIAWLAELRLHALNWVCGYGDTWDDVPLYPD